MIHIDVHTIVTNYSEILNMVKQGYILGPELKSATDNNLIDKYKQIKLHIDKNNKLLELMTTVQFYASYGVIRYRLADKDAVYFKKDE